METYCVNWTVDAGWSDTLPAIDGPQTLVTVFGGARAVVGDAVAEVLSTYPRSVIIGCSTAGEISGDRVDDDTVAVSVARFDEVSLSVASESVDGPQASTQCGVDLGRRLHAADAELQAVLVLSDGLRVNGSALVAGLQAQLGSGVTITGGLAGDGDRFGATWVLAEGAIREGWVTAVGLSGPRLQVGCGSAGGWDIFGPERRVTRAEGNVVFELDGRPALALYKSYLGERADGLPATGLLFPLAVRAPGASGGPLVRTILGVDEQAQSMTFAGDVPEGSLAQLMRANFDRVIDGAHAAAVATDAPSDRSEPTLAIAISCVGRRLVLDARIEEELEAVVTALTPQTRLTGFYSYGEISPVEGGCALHNQTMTLTTLRERGR